MAISAQPITLDRLEDDLRGIPAHWLPRAEELRGFLERWEQAWNAHDLDVLEQMVTEDITWEDPAMHGETVHGRAEFRAFAETLFRAFPDVDLQGIGTPYFDLEGTGLGLRWQMTGTFTGELAIWSKHLGSAGPTIPPTGERFDLEGIDLYEFRDGMICNYSILYDLTTFSQQLGLLSSGDG
jgi:steroid delta-isomerase-like uncharacterized protein